MYEDLLDYFSKRLIELRMDKNVSARGMSLDIGQSKGYIAQLERKASLPSMMVFFQICDYLNITPRDFFDEGIKHPEKLQSIIENLKLLNDKQLINVDGIISSIVNK